MGEGAADRAFGGSIPEIYDRYLVPLIFEPYAADLAARIHAIAAPHARVLEIAAGTGVLTRAMSATLPGTVSIVASDLNPAMLQRAAATGTVRPVEWRQADAQQLPFDDHAFDVVACQFGAMFFPDKGGAFAEARRVLRPGGRLFFSVWDRIEHNEFADCITSALAAAFPDASLQFLARTPHGYFERNAIARDVASGGFRAAPAIETVKSRSRAASARVPAVAYAQGTPLRNELEAQGAHALEMATSIAEEAIAQRFGRGEVDGLIQAVIVQVAAD